MAGSFRTILREGVSISDVMLYFARVRGCHVRMSGRRLYYAAQRDVVSLEEVLNMLHVDSCEMRRVMQSRGLGLRAGLSIRSGLANKLPCSRRRRQSAYGVLISKDADDKWSGRCASWCMLWPRLLLPPHRSPAPLFAPLDQVPAIVYPAPAPRN